MTELQRLLMEYHLARDKRAEADAVYENAYNAYKERLIQESEAMVEELKTLDELRSLVDPAWPRR
jgi:hypothetical protein